METYRILILGDSPADAAALSADSAIVSAFRPFAELADASVLGVRTPQSRQLTSDDASAVARIGVDAVNLAHSSTMAHGTDGLDTTLAALDSTGLQSFGAGRTRAAAQAPLRIDLPDEIGGGEVNLHASVLHPVRTTRAQRVYADADSAGCAPLTISSSPLARAASTSADTLRIALPTWGESGHWRTQRQFALAHRLLAKEYDLVLGQGAGHVQEIHRKQQRWVVYGIGNGLTESPRFQPDDETSGVNLSFWIMLEIHRDGDRRWVEAKLYPVRTAGPDVGPVPPEDLDRVIQALSARPERPWRFTNPAMNTETDQLGHHLVLQLGDWPIGKPFSRLTPTFEGADAGDWPLRGPSLSIEDRILGSNKQLGVAMLAVAAEAEGGTVHWLGRTLALIECRGKRLLSFRYRNHETSLGAVLVRDKVLTARILERAGVPTPETFLVKSADDAVRVASTVPGPVVIKPRFGVESIGVSTGLTTDDEVREAFRFARDNGSQVILQPHIHFTEELRIMASPEGAMAVNGRALPHVIGDGVSTIAQLIADKNRQRTLNPSLEKRPIPIDPLTHRQLSKLGLTVDSVPDLGVRIIVRNVAGLSVGGDTIQALDETADDIKAAAANAVAAIPGLGWGGADVIIEDGTQRPLVIEINTQAAYGAALFPAYGEPNDVSAAAWTVRYEATAPEVTAAPEAAEFSDTSVPVVLNQRLFGKSTSVPFRQLFLDSLTRLPHPVTKPSFTVRQVSTPRGPILVTRTGLTAADRFVVEKVMKRHQWVSRILALRSVPQPPSATVATTAQLRRFVEEHPDDVTLRTVETAWKGPNTYLLSPEETMEKSALSGACWVQTRPQGTRLRVLTSHVKAHAVIASQKQPSVSAESVRAAGLLAVHAVHAVPELRWAAIDIVLPASGCTSELLVEGLTTAPTFTSEDQIIAGDIDEFCQWIVEADDVPVVSQPII